MEAIDVLRDIRGYASANRYTLTNHAWKRLRERGLIEEDVRYALMQAQCCVEQAGGKWEVKSADRDGDPLTLIVAIHDGVIVITVFGDRYEPRFMKM